LPRQSQRNRPWKRRRIAARQRCKRESSLRACGYESRATRVSSGIIDGGSEAATVS
jgi:hypothetical protein